MLFLLRMISSKSLGKIKVVVEVCPDDGSTKKVHCKSVTSKAPVSQNPCTSVSTMAVAKVAVV